MSNQLVGLIYQRIISEVIESSAVDFEEGGVDSSTLDELKQGWQQKLSSLGVAQFPWDPTPAPAVIANPAPVPSNGPAPSKPTPLPSTTTPSPSSSTAPNKSNTSAGGPQVKVKTEPGLDSSAQPSQKAPSQPAPAISVAAQRAASLMQEKFGSQANSSIDAMKSSGLALPPNTRPAQGGTSPQQKNGAPPQTDGATDASSSWDLIMQTRRADGSACTTRIEADATLRHHVLSTGQAMEGGGLMLPLHQRVKGTKRKLTPASALTPQCDGNLDSESDDDDNNDAIKTEPAPDLFEEEIDEDAINSDLDDPDENIASDQDDDENMVQIMLCMYDKVQRVKNKWKCTLKDGVLTVNGREYVFHKATGEFEW